MGPGADKDDDLATIVASIRQEEVPADMAFAMA